MLELNHLWIILFGMLVAGGKGLIGWWLRMKYEDFEPWKLARAFLLGAIAGLIGLFVSIGQGEPLTYASVITTIIGAAYIGDLKKEKLAELLNSITYEQWIRIWEYFTTKEK